MNLFRRLINFIKGLWLKKVPFNLAENEILVRGIVHPHFYSNSKNKLKPEAFLPPPDRRDVSLLRREFTNDNFCKNHSASLVIKGNTYCGLATFRFFSIAFLNNDPTIETTVQINGTPMDSDGKYITGPPVFINDPGLPMHADLLYERPMMRGEPNTIYRKYANNIVKASNYFHDKSPSTNNWAGPSLT